MGQSKYTYHEFSGALQQKSTTHIKKPNEVRRVKNVDFGQIIGAMRRRKGAQGSATGYVLPKFSVATPPLGAYIARFPTAVEIWAVRNNAASSPTSSILQYWTGPAATDWTDIQTGMPPSLEFNMTDDLDDIWVASWNPITDVVGDPFTVDSSHNVSTQRHLEFAPKGRFYMEFAGSMWAANVSVLSDDVVPTMTASATPSGLADASTEFNANLAAWHAFDGITKFDNKWCANAATGWLRYDFGSGVAKIITAYAVTAVPDGEPQYITRAPASWTFEGSNNGSSWTTLHTVSGAPDWKAGERRVYNITNSTSYRYYRINVSANKGDALLAISEMEMFTTLRYQDRLYKSSGPTGVMAFVRAAQNLTQVVGFPTEYTNPLEVDSVRYIKKGMVIDIYQAGTEVKLYSLTVADVDKALDTVRFTPPDTQTFANTDINTGTDVITIPNVAWLSTGTPVTFWQGSGLPGGITQGGLYYVIRASSTTIKLATSRANALAGTGIDITSQGTGTHRVTLTPVFGNKDEFWKSGRKGKLSRLWNTDYRNPELADWIKIPSTFDAENDITAVGKLANRMFVFTLNGMIKYDGQNIIPLRNDVGCVAHRSIAYYDSFMVWLDNKGQIWIRNEEGGEQDVISEAIQDTMAQVPQSQLSESTAVCVGKKYKLYLGQIDGKSLRVVYDFRTNQWSEEWWTPKMPIQLEYTYGSNVKPHFFDETGQLWVDEEGNDDNGVVIPFEAELGDDNFGMEELKSYKGIKVYSDAVAACKLFAQVDGGPWKDVGQITKPVQSLPLALPKGTLLNLRFVDSSSHDPVQIDKATVWFTREEDTFRAS